MNECTYKLPQRTTGQKERKENYKKEKAFLEEKDRVNQTNKKIPSSTKLKFKKMKGFSQFRKPTKCWS